MCCYRMPWNLSGCLLGWMILWVVPFLFAQIPPPNNSFATAATEEPVSVFSRPDGGGFGLDECWLQGSNTRIDATITVTVLDGWMDPVVNYPAEDIWIWSNVIANFIACPNGTIADHNTNSSGQTTFSLPLLAGGHGFEAVVFLNGNPLWQSPFANFSFNSPDMNGDLVVNLTDIVFFAQIFEGGLGYDYSADFTYDQVVNLSDIVYMAQAIGASCP